MSTTFPANVRARASCDVPFEFLNAKVRGRRSRLCEGDRLRELVRERGIVDLAYRLYPREDIRDQFALERRMFGACVEELASFAVYLSGSYRAFYAALLARYPVENLKVMLRLLGRNGQEADPADLLIELPRGLSLPVEELLGSADMEEFVGRIPLPAVRSSGQEALPLYRETGRRAYLEMAFDRGYWAAVREGLERLGAGERAQCSAPIRNEFGAMALLGTLRAARIYRIPSEHCMLLLPAGWGGVGLEALLRLHSSPDPESVLEEISLLGLVPGGPLSADLMEDIGQLEEVLWHGCVRLANRQYYTNMSGPAVLVSYFYLKREELRHLLGLVQMLRHGRTEEEMFAHVEL